MGWYLQMQLRRTSDLFYIRDRHVKDQSFKFAVVPWRICKYAYVLELYFKTLLIEFKIEFKSIDCEDRNTIDFMIKPSLWMNEYVEIKLKLNTSVLKPCDYGILGLI